MGQETHHSPDHQGWNDDSENQDSKFHEADIPSRKEIVDEIDCPGNGPEYCQEQCPVLDDLCPADFFRGPWGGGFMGTAGSPMFCGAALGYLR